VFIKNAIINKQSPSRKIQISAIIIIACTTLLLLYRNGFFYGRKLIDATFLDDLSREDLALFQDGHYILKSGWILGEETFTGTYKRNDSILIFDNYPKGSNDFISKSMIIKGNRIYFRDNNTDTSFYHFKIHN
jgi:predicted acylesterase/phospholipase RssA